MIVKLVVASWSIGFKNNLFPFIQKNSSKLKSQIKQIDDADFTNDPDHDLIERGD